MFLWKSKRSILWETLLWYLVYSLFYEAVFTAAIQSTTEAQIGKYSNNDLCNSTKYDQGHISNQTYSWSKDTIDITTGDTELNDDKDEDHTRRNELKKTLIVKRDETQENQAVTTKQSDSQTKEIESDTAHASETNKDNIPTQTSEITSTTTSTKTKDQIDNTFTAVRTTVSKTSANSSKETTTNDSTAATAKSSQADPEQRTSSDRTTDSFTTTSSVDQNVTPTEIGTAETKSATHSSTDQEETSTPEVTKYNTLTTTNSAIEYTITTTVSPLSATNYITTSTAYTPTMTTKYTTGRESSEAVSATYDSDTATINDFTSTQFPTTTTYTDYPSITSTTESAEIATTHESYKQTTVSVNSAPSDITDVLQPTSLSGLSQITNAEAISALGGSQASTTISDVSTPTSTTTNELSTLFSNANSMFSGSETIDFPTNTRSFSVISSTATPLLVLGSKECTGDAHAIDGKCPQEYFCNAAKKTCVLLLADGEQCFEDFQCASTYCTMGLCGAQQKESSQQGGKIAGAVIGGVVGVSLLVFALLRWRKKSRVIGRRMNQFQEKQQFYDATTTIVPDARLSKYNFLQQMLEPAPQRQAMDFTHIPPAANERVKSRLPRDINYDAWSKEDEETLHQKAYQYF